MTPKPVIVWAKRTAIGKANGQFSKINPENLIEPLFSRLLTDTSLNPIDIEDVILGNAVGGGGNIARLALLHAGLPETVPGQTIDRQCSSGLDAVILACRLIQAGAGTCYLAGGVESTSRAPLRAHRPFEKYNEPEFYDRAKHAPDAFGDPSMGEAAENVAEHYGLTKEEQDVYALSSHRKALQAQKNGIFDREIVAVTRQLEKDESPRSSLTPALLSRQRPAFRENGTVTPGNSCPLNDGAALTLILSEDQAQRLGYREGLRFVDSAVAGVDPKLLGMGPVPATRKLFAQATDYALDKVAQVEFNEAFASQTIACLRELKYSRRKNLPAWRCIGIGTPVWGFRRYSRHKAIYRPPHE